jgi:hypothetical protein
MRFVARHAGLLLIGVAVIGVPWRRVRAQAPAADPADVATIPGIVRASYEVISGPAGTPRQWRRDSTLYMPGATFVALGERDGKVRARILTPEEYRRSTNDSFVGEGLFEYEIGSRIERFGNVAQVRSVYQIRHALDGPVIGSGVNYFQLFWDGTRWWIAGMVWDDARANNPIPEGWAGVPTRAGD